jgi:hypothetical protein
VLVARRAHGNRATVDEFVAAFLACHEVEKLLVL